MQMGRYLLDELKCDVDGLTHLNFGQAREWVENHGEKAYINATEVIEKALERLYGERSISLQQLSATFRRGDLFWYMDPDFSDLQEIEF